MQTAEEEIGSVKISFVIPAYNAESYVDRCLDSIAAQSCGDYEVIVIDDGSTDATAERVRARSQSDVRIHLYQRANGGQGAARSFGITVARGQWIWFVDSDDWLIEESLVRIVAILERHDPDVLVANFAFAFDHSPAQPASLVPPRLAGQLVTPREDPDAFASVSCWNTPPWRLISRRRLLVERDIRFAEGVFYEDHPFAIQLMLEAGKVFVDAPVSYAYYQRADSTTHVNDRKAFDFIKIRRQCIDLLKAYRVFEAFPTIATSYIAPLNFYDAHVGDEYRQVFLQKLAADLTDEEEAFAREHGGPAIGLFLDAVRSGRPTQAGRSKGRGRLLRLLTREGRARARERIRASARFRLGRLVRRARDLALGQQAHAGVDYSGRRFLSAGSGTRVEQIMIDVRVMQEDRPYVVVGTDSHIGGQFVFERGVGQIHIGSRSSIGGGCLLICSQSDGIRIGDRVMLSWNVTVTDTNAHSLDPSIRHNDAYDWKCGVDAGRVGAYKDWANVDSRPVTIEDSAWIGFGAAILKGVTIGRGAVVGAHSVVTRDVAPFTIVAGNPARFIRLVPRRSWTWEDIVHAMQGDPAMQETLRAAYLHPDLLGGLKRYRESEEFRDTAALARTFAEHPSRMLDVGAGSGVCSVAFALEGFDVTALEPSADTLVGAGAASTLLEQAEALDATLPERLRIVQDSIESAPLEGPFDFVLCRQVTHHFADPVAALDRIRRLLAPDGVVLLVREHVIFDEADRERFLEHHPMHRYYGGENAYTVEEYVDIARRAGFRTEKVIGFRDSPINYFPHSAELVYGLSERDVPGRPYTFVLLPSGDPA